MAAATTKSALPAAILVFDNLIHKIIRMKKLTGWSVSENCDVNAARDDASNDTLLGSDRFYSASTSRLCINCPSGSTALPDVATWSS